MENSKNQHDLCTRLHSGTLSLTRSIKTCDAQASLGCPRRMLPLRWPPAATRSNDDTDRPVHSPMLSHHYPPLRRPPSTEPRSMISGSTSWRQTWPNQLNRFLDSWNFSQSRVHYNSYFYQLFGWKIGKEDVIY